MAIWWRQATSNDGQSPLDLDYSARLQALDRRQGRRDGKRRMPAIRQLNLLREIDPSLTPLLPYIGRLTQQAERLWSLAEEEFVQDTAEARTRLAGLGVTGNNLQEARAEAEAQLEEARKIASEPLSDEELSPRTEEEEALSAAALRVRREAVRRQAVTDAEQRLEGLIGMLRTTEVDLAKAREQVRSRRKQALARVQQIAAHISERIDMYWSGVVDRHWAGGQLSMLQRGKLALPGWAMTDDIPIDPTIEKDGWL